MNSTHFAKPHAGAKAADLAVRTLAPEMKTRWDDYVSSKEGATFFHRAGWKEVIERAFGHEAKFLFAERDGKLCGILPLGHIRSRLFGNALISSPFCVYGGVVADDDAVADVLIEAACDQARALGVDYLEMRGRRPSRPDWPTKDLYVTFRKAIDPDPEKNMLNIPRKQRAMVRKGIKNGLSSEIDDDTGRFFDMYSTSVRNLGTPVLPRKYFRILKEVFAADCEILTVTHEGNAVSSVISFYFRDEVLPYYGGGDESARRLAANDFMYWEVMRRACERGCRVFDYGRSKQGTGSYSFKKNWGFEPEPLYYQYYLVKAKEMPDINPLNPKYRLFVNLWKRLPLPVSRLVGPVLSRNLG